MIRVRRELHTKSNQQAASSVKPAAISLCAIALVLATAACSSDNRKVLIVYSPHGKELLEYFEKGFERAHPEVDVQWVDMGSQEVLERVRAEKPNPQADVWFGAPAETFDRATKEDLLQPYKPTWAAAIDGSAIIRMILAISDGSASAGRQR